MGQFFLGLGIYRVFILVCDLVFLVGRVFSFCYFQCGGFSWDDIAYCYKYFFEYENVMCFSDYSLAFYQRVVFFLMVVQVFIVQFTIYLISFFLMVCIFVVIVCWDESFVFFFLCTGVKRFVGESFEGVFYLFVFYQLIVIYIDVIGLGL